MERSLGVKKKNRGTSAQQGHNSDLLCCLASCGVRRIQFDEAATLLGLTTLTMDPECAKVREFFANVINDASSQQSIQLIH